MNLWSDQVSVSETVFQIRRALGPVVHVILFGPTKNPSVRARRNNGCTIHINIQIQQMNTGFESHEESAQNLPCFEKKSSLKVLDL